MKREWRYPIADVPEKGLDPMGHKLWAIVERLEALVSIMDELEQVGDVIANHLSFGGQPVGESTNWAQQNWQCQKTKECLFFNGHQGACVRPQDNVVGTDLCPAILPATGEQCMLLAGHDSIHAFPKPGESDEPEAGKEARRAGGREGKGNTTSYPRSKKITRERGGHSAPDVPVYQTGLFDETRRKLYEMWLSKRGGAPCRVNNRVT